MSIYYVLGFLSAIFFTIAYIPYIVSVIQGKTKPHPFSWLLWGLIGILSLYFYIHVGAHETLPFAYCGAVFPFVIFLFSIKYWKGGFSQFDYLVLALSLVSIILYLIFHSATVSLSMSILADMFAFMPTLRKTYLDPSSESLSSWGLFLTSYFLSVFAISKWTYGVAIFPCYLAVFGTIMCILILRGKSGRLKKHSNNV